MGKDDNVKKEGKAKGFFARLAEKLDKKIQEKAKTGSSCCGSGSDKGANNSCCN